MGSSLTGNVGKELSRPVAKMIRNILLLSLVALATSTTITITTDGNTLTCGADFCSGASPVPTAEEIKLVRDSWPIIKKNKAVLSEFVLEHFRVHPKTQELLPELAQVALADLPTHPYFVTLSETYVVLAMNEMIDNLDNAGVLSKLLECLHPEWYVDYVSIERQNKETLRIFYKVLEEQMGGELSAETKAAWVKGMDYAFTFLKMRPSQTHLNSQLSVDDITLVRKFHAAHRHNPAIATRALMKMFTEHPESQKLVPALAGVPLNELAQNEDFVVLANFASAVVTFIVTNLDNEQILTHILYQQTKPEQFVDYVSPIHQLDETAHVILTAIKEEVTVDDATYKAMQNVMAYVNGIMALKVAPNSDIKSTTEPVVSAAHRSLIRSTWDQMRFNSNVAPKILMKLFSAHPRAQKLFAKIAEVSTFDLMENKDFLALSYTFYSQFNLIVNNVDNPEIIKSQVARMISPSFFIDPSASIAQQLERANKIILEIFGEELGSSFTDEAAAAWTSLLKIVYEVVEKYALVQPITTEEQIILKDNIQMIQKQNKDFGSDILMKMFRTYPQTKSLFPNFAKLETSSLIKNPELKAIGRMMLSGFDMMMENIHQPAVLRRMLDLRPFESYFVSGVSIYQQLEETGNLVMEALDEELGTRFVPSTRQIWKRAFHLVNSIMAEPFE